LENRRSLARSANTGISSFINQRGDVIEQTKWNKTVGLRKELNRNKKLSFYSQHGDYIGRFSYLASFFFILFLLIRKIQSLYKRGEK